MKLTTLCSAIALLACAATSAHAADVVYAGDLTPAAQTGSAGGYSWFFDDGTAVEFWRLFSTAGSTVTRQVNRLDGGFDPALSLYSGVTSAHTSEFLSYGDWGGLSYIDYLDDENPAFVAGPGGDPFGSFVAPVTGYYTVAVGGSLSLDDDPYAYNISAVPEPETALMLGPNASDLSEAAASNTVYSEHNRVTHVYLQQFHRGIAARDIDAQLSDIEGILKFSLEDLGGAIAACADIPARAYAMRVTQDPAGPENGVRQLSEQAERST